MIIAYNSKIFRSRNALCSYLHDKETWEQREAEQFTPYHSTSLARPGIVAGILRPNPLPYLQGPLCLSLLTDNECEGDKALTVPSYPRSNIAQWLVI